MPVQILKLSNGETIVADVLDATDRVVTVLNPIEIKTEINSRNVAVLVGHQWLPMFEDENVMYIHQHHIVGMVHASSDVQEYYVDALNKILYPERAEQIQKEQEDYLKKILFALSNTSNQSYH